MKTIAVIGGGITGVTTAYALARRGFSVTLFEKQRYAAMETSFANGGQLSASNAEVWTHWSTILKGLKWMLKSDAPLLVNPQRAAGKQLHELARLPGLAVCAGMGSRGLTLAAFHAPQSARKWLQPGGGE